MPTIALTDLAVRNLKPVPGKRVTYLDKSIKGFGVRVTENGAKSFVLTYGEDRKRITLGIVGIVALKDARDKGRGLGGTFGISTEYLLFARRGSMSAKERHWSTWFEAKRGLHSVKPAIAREIIEKCFDGKRIELFARQTSPGWDVWGNEVESDISLVA